MAKYHVNPVTMKPSICVAKVNENCKYYNHETNTAPEHYDQIEVAYKAVEEKLSKDYSNTDTFTKPPKTVLAEYGVEEVYKHPQGKIIKIVNGEAIAYKNGKKAYSSATTEKLRKGYGAWKKLEDKDLEEQPVLPKIKPFEIKPYVPKEPIYDINKTLGKYNYNDEVYVHDSGKVIYIDENNEIHATGANGQPIITTLTPAKLRKGFGAWKKYEIEPPTNKTKTQIYAERQDILIKKLAKFMKDNEHAGFVPWGAVQAKYWEDIKNGNTEGKSEAVKNTMIVTAFKAISNVGYNVDTSEFAKAVGKEKYDAQEKQFAAFKEISENESIAAYYNKPASYAPPGKKNSYKPTANPNSRTGVKYDQLNLEEKHHDFINKHLGEVKKSVTKNGVSFTEYTKPEFTDGRKGCVSLVKATGNIGNYKFTENSFYDFGFNTPEITDKDTTMWQYDKDRTFNIELSEKSIEKLKNPEKNALTWYTGSSYRDFNRTIFKRQGISKEDAAYNRYRSKMRNLDSAIAKAPKIDKIVYRAVRSSASIFKNEALGEDINERVQTYVKDNYQVGKRVSFKGYQSTSATRTTAYNWLGTNKSGVIYEIKTPEGIAIRNISSISEENEVLLPRESEYVVVGVHKDKRGTNIVQMVAINENGDLLDGTNSGQRTTWEELYAQPLAK